MGNHAMSPEQERQRTLVGALADFRAELTRLFDECIATHQVRSADLPPSPSMVSAPLEPYPISVATAPASMTLPVSSVAMAPVSAPVVAAPASPEASQGAVSPPTAAAKPRSRENPDPVADPISAEPTSKDRSENPRQRLDALARMLDRRLKQNGSGSSESIPKPHES